MKKAMTVPLLIYSYIALPFIIFAAGFLKPYFALPVTILMVAAVFFAAKHSNGLDSIPLLPNDIFKIVFGVLLIVFIVLLSGIGDVFWQNNDHATRNTLFDILTTYEWPPKYSTASGDVSIIYYIGFWLPSALIGKLFSLNAGYIFQVFWASAALCIIWYLLCVMDKKIVIYPLIIFLFFSGMDTLGYSFVTSIFSNPSKLQLGKWVFTNGSAFSRHIEWWPKYFQYSSHMTQLFWVFNQSLPVWIATLLLLVEKSNKNLVFIMGVTLLSSTLPFVGLIPIFIWCAVCSHSEGTFLDRPITSDFKSSFLSLFTYQNVVGGGLSGILSFLYLIGNIASSQKSLQASSAGAVQSEFSLMVFLSVFLIWLVVYSFFEKSASKNPWHLLYLIPSLPLAFFMAKLPSYKLIYYVMFILLEFLILSAILIPAHKKSTLFFITVSSLMIIPFFVVGKSIDFCMRASIPLLVVLCLFATDGLKKYLDSGKEILATILCTILMIGAITPAREIVRTLEATSYELRTKGKVENDSKTVRQVFGGRNFTGKTENNIFFKYIAK